MIHVNDIDIISIFGRKMTHPKNSGERNFKIHNPKLFEDPRCELIDRQSPKSETKFAADP